MHSDNRRGFITLFTLILVTALIALVTYLFSKSNTFNRLSNTTIKLAQARELALSGVDLGLALLVIPPSVDEHKSFAPKKEQQEQEDPEKQLLAHILPALNRWQSFVLTEKEDGIDARIQVCVCSEDGKINLNQIYDFQKHEFMPLGTGSWEDLLEKLSLSGRKNKSLTEALAAFLKKRRTPLEDPSVLLEDEAFSLFRDRQFYQPPQDDNQVSQRPLYLFDLFTTATDTAEINPWLLSDSLCGAIEAQRAGPGQIDKRKNSVQQWLQGFSADADWATQWDAQLKPIYNKEFATLPKGFAEALCSTCTMHVFSIVVRAEYEGVVQRVVAIASRKQAQESLPEGNSANANQEATHKQAQAPQFEMQKVYWL